MPVTRRFGVEGREGLGRIAREWIAAGSIPAEPGRAATVMLLRDTPQGPEVFVQRRASTMAFAPSMVVFPGGRVDPADADAVMDEDALETLATRMRLSATEARPAIAAALREVEEECGVRIGPDGLHPVARWVTPKFEPRRYDTWFFAARMPADQVAEGTTSETVDERWGQPAGLLALRESGDLLLMPPTIVMLEGLAEYDTVDGYLAHRPSLDLIEPTLVETDDGFALESTIP